LRKGLAGIGELNARAHAIEVRPDIAGYADLAHVFDLRGSLLAARATLDCALERRETRGAHNRSDFPDLDPRLQVNLVWTAEGTVTHEAISPPAAEIAVLAGEPEIDADGRLLE
jgi:succinate dehydrogenase / fumarate reductase, flavoprotein subunit